jgi:hypothetical protein
MKHLAFQGTRFPSMASGRHTDQLAPARHAKVATPTEGLKQAGRSRNSGGARLRSGRDAMTDLGQTEKSGRATGKSVLPSRADIVNRTSLVRSVPKSDMVDLVGAKKVPPKGGLKKRATEIGLVDQISLASMRRSSMLLPAVSISLNQRGVLPRPAQVCEGSSGF